MVSVQNDANLDCADVIAPAGGRREARRRDRREAILCVAEASFLSEGYAATTMSGIAATLGGSKGTLWSYFPSKEVLFAAVLDRATETFRDEMSDLLDRRDPVEAVLRRAMRRLLEKFTSPQSVALHRVVIAEAHRFPEMSQIFSERAVGRGIGLLADYLAGAMARGDLRSAEPLIAAQQMRALLMSGCHHKLMLGVIETATPEMVESDSSIAVETFLRAYAV